MSDAKADEIIRAVRGLAVSFVFLGTLVNLICALCIVLSIESLSAKFPRPVTVVSTEFRVMSNDRINPPFYENGVLNINSLDPLDPVHLRRARDRKDFSYDGDLGREHEDYCRDNDIGYGSRPGLGDWKQIAEVLPVIEAPSIVAEHPASAEQTLAYLRKTESE